MKTALHLAAAILVAFATPAPAIVIAYAYDSTGRLTGANYGGVSNTTYAYDPNGNLLARTNTVSQFLPLAGKYSGLVLADPASNAGAGVVSLTVTLTGGFSGTLVLGGKTFKLKGEFAADGTPTLLTLAGGIQLALDLDPATHTITGALSGSVVATLSASAAPFGKKNPAPGGAVGKFTGLFAATENLTTKPKGTGIGSVTIAATGSVKLAGTLADGTKISQGTALDANASWPLFASIYKKKGFVGGFVAYTPEPGTGDFAGTLDWLKPAGAGLYPGGFTTELEFSAARYVNPAKGQRVLDLPATSPNGVFLADGSTVDRVFTLGTDNKIVVAAPNPEQLKLKLNVKTGAVSGSLLLGGKTRKLTGILQLEQNLGAGFLFTDTESLPFTLGED